MPYWECPFGDFVVNSWIDEEDEAFVEEHEKRSHGIGQEPSVIPPLVALEMIARQ